MAGRSRDSAPNLPSIRDSSPTSPRLDAAEVMAALGAQPAGGALGGTLAPLNLFAVRTELARRLQSSGGRPALSGTTRRAKVPLGDEEWLQLEALAAAIAAPGLNPTAGQVASALLTLSVRMVAAEVFGHEPPSTSATARELAVRSAALPPDSGSPPD